MKQTSGGWVTILEDTKETKEVLNLKEFLGTDNRPAKEMIRMVPTPKLPNSSFDNPSDFDPTHSLTSQIDFTENFDFDLGLLPSSDCNQENNLPLSPPTEDLNDFFTVPSPSDQTCLSPNLTTDLDYSGANLTMFSPNDGSKWTKSNFLPATSPARSIESPNCYVPSASPAASVTSSCPYSPAPRIPQARFSSTDSYANSTSSTSTSLNLKEDLKELAELQKSMKMETPSSVDQHHPMEHQEPRFDMMSILNDVNLDLLEHEMREDIKNQCSMLNIHPDPTCWSQSEVARWLRQKMQELKIPAASCQPALQWAANFEGKGLVQITEQEFKARFPQGGDQIYSALEMWRNAALYQSESNQVQPTQNHESGNSSEVYDLATALEMFDGVPEPYVPPPPEYSEVASKTLTPLPPAPCFAEEPISHNQVPSSLNTQMPPIEELLHEVKAPPPYPGTTTLTNLQPLSSTATHDLTEDEADDEMTDPTSPVSATTPSQRPAPGPVRGGSSSNIHLWQFVKELLNRAEHSGCIHWVDRDQGIFKIVDSVRVAELWGKRKNRPAMNFDKLSRSLRQYYKKGIMKKTSRPQRLVYQFCSPYHK